LIRGLDPVRSVVSGGIAGQPQIDMTLSIAPANGIHEGKEAIIYPSSP